MSAKHVFASVRTLPGKQFLKGVTIKPLAGQQMLMMHAELDPDSEVPTHSHPHEQIGLVVEGELDFWIADEKRALKPGDMYAIPGGTPHGCRTGRHHAVVVEAFHPVREDYLK